MPGTTPKGYPYAQPADPLIQWPATSQALAEKIDAASGARIVVGHVSGPANASGMIEMSFPAGVFTKAPFVVMTPHGFTGVAPGKVPIIRNDGTWVPTKDHAFIANLVAGEEFAATWFATESP
jgi:hypothetical protein